MPGKASVFLGDILYFFIFECFDMLTDPSRKFLQWTLTLEIAHLKKRGALHFLNGCPDSDSNDENLLKQTMKICWCKNTSTSVVPHGIILGMLVITGLEEGEGERLDNVHQGGVMTAQTAANRGNQGK